MKLPQIMKHDIPDLKNVYSSGEFAQSLGQYNIFCFDEEKNRMIVAFINIRKRLYGTKQSVSVYEYLNVPKQIQQDLMYQIDNRKPFYLEVVGYMWDGDTLLLKGEKTIGFNRIFIAEYRDILKWYRKIDFVNEKAKLNYVKKLKKLPHWDKDKVKPQLRTKKIVNMWNKEADRQYNEIYSQLSPQKEI